MARDTKRSRVVEAEQALADALTAADAAGWTHETEVAYLNACDVHLAALEAHVEACVGEVLEAGIEVAVIAAALAAPFEEGVPW